MIRKLAIAVGCQFAIRFALFGGLGVFLSATTMAAQEISVVSPDGRSAIVVTTDEQAGSVAYEVTFDKKIVINKSKLGLRVERKSIFAPGWKFATVDRREFDQAYEVPVGKSSTARAHFHEAKLTFDLPVGGAGDVRKVELIARAYNEGIAFRYTVQANADSVLEVASEETEFRFPDEAKCYALPLKNFTTPYEAIYLTERLDNLPTGQLFGLPMLLNVDGSVWAGVTEARLVHYAGLYVERRDGQPGLASRLSPLPGQQDVAVRAKGQIETPWRVIMLSDRVGALIESNLVLHLNDPCQIEDTSWIKPGKILFPWWNGYVADGQGFDGDLDTRTIKHHIDFCAKHGIEYASFDGYEDRSWYGGGIFPREPVDVTTGRDEVDVKEILRYAKEKNVRMRAWMHWQAIAPQLDYALERYEQMGIEGIMVDFTDRDDQQMVEWYEEVVHKSATRHLTVNFHGAYKPTGLRRTWPNLLTREGVLNLEHGKWATCPPEHNVTVPFLRMLAGPLDYHQGGFLNASPTEFQTRDRRPQVAGSRCHVLAMYVVYENPLPMLADFPAAYEQGVGIDFLSKVPVTWDETRVLGGEVGEFIAIARRKGDTWYVGSMNGTTERGFALPLTFLQRGRTYRADVLADRPDGRYTDVDKSTREVTSSDMIEGKMVPAGGHVVVLTPLSEG